MSNRQMNIRTIGDLCFGEPSMTDPKERLLRFGEEAFELMRAAGMTREEMMTLIDYEFERPAGSLPQELAGTGVTLYALADVHGYNLETLIDDESSRVLDQREKIRAKAQNKPDSVVSTRTMKPGEAA